MFTTVCQPNFRKHSILKSFDLATHLLQSLMVIFRLHSIQTKLASNYPPVKFPHHWSEVSQMTRRTCAETKLEALLS